MMFLKRMWRKPLIPLLILAEFIAAVLFMVVNENNIQKNLQAIDQLYDNATIECQVMPNSVSVTGLELSPFSAQDIYRREEVTSYLSAMFSPGYLYGEKADGEPYVIYGTNDLKGFCDKMSITPTMAEGHTIEGFCDEKAVCLLMDRFAEEKGYEIGDTVLLTGGGERGTYIEGAPVQELTVVGIYSNEGVTVEAFVVPESCIYEKDEKRLIFNDNTRRLWYKYSKFYFTIDSAYNKNFEELETSLEEQIGAMGDYTLHSGTRELEESIRPLENKLELQRWLSIPIRLAFVGLSALLTLLLLAQERQEILIRRMRGESGLRVMLETFGAVCLLLILMTVPAVLLAVLLDGSRVMLEHLIFSVVISGISGGILLAVLCRKGLISLYQSSKQE